MRPVSASCTGAAFPMTLVSVAEEFEYNNPKLLHVKPESVLRFKTRSVPCTWRNDNQHLKLQQPIEQYEAIPKNRHKPTDHHVRGLPQELLMYWLVFEASMVFYDNSNHLRPSQKRRRN